MSTRGRITMSGSISGGDGCARSECSLLASLGAAKTAVKAVEPCIQYERYVASCGFGAG